MRALLRTCTFASKRQRMSLVQLFETWLLKKVEFKKCSMKKWSFQKAEYLVKAVKKCFLKKLSIWLALIKVAV